jgi:hypothetical protein
MRNCPSGCSLATNSRTTAAIASQKPHGYGAPRRNNLEALKDLFVQLLRLCQKAGMVSRGHVALDVTKVQANAPQHKAMSYERMFRPEKELEKEINALMRRA